MNAQDAERARRELRSEIARLRRAIDRRLRDTGTRMSELTSWQAQVRRHPAVALGLGLSGGWLLAGVLRRGGWLGWLLKEGLGIAGHVARQRAMTELASLWQGLGPKL